MKKFTIPGRRKMNPGIIASMMKRGRNLWSWLNDVVIREY
jgi:hypothetical protein